MNKYKGGRGHKAPYESLTMRVPLELKSVVSEIVDNYRNNLTIENKSKEVTLIEKIKDIQNKINNKERGYKSNGAGQLIRDILRL